MHGPLTSGERIRVTGVVQGVGFRPTVWRLARQCDLAGAVWNDADGVVIDAWGEAAARDRFVGRLRAETPPLARIDRIRREPLQGTPPAGFRIDPSRAGRPRTEVAADAATCPQCLAEVLDPGDRRHGYPFTNCTHCGPRLSIVRAIPYDRANTSMARFPLCPQCRAEYDDPADRRFHAQPNACPACGPRLWLEEGDEEVTARGEAAIERTAALLRSGHIVAIKGIGGFHLACDAGDAAAVARLRVRKRRRHKPLALMARDLEMVRRHARVGAAEAELLRSPAAPIVVLQAAGGPLPEALAPGQEALGFMLPYTPLHHLLMARLARPIVLTSGNHSGQPQVTANAAARERLAGIADALLLHDREIVNRLDDSVVRLADGRPRLLRRARGYAPRPQPLPAGLDGPSVLAMGGELKSTFCLLREGGAILSQHLGDLEEAATWRDYRHNLGLYRRLFGFDPEVIAVDPHPGYLSTALGREIAAAGDAELVAVQHHHAHIAACMAENGIGPGDGAVLGVALDGLGYGDDGTLWGGEFLRADYRGYHRLARFRPVAMPGGARAVREPWRNALAHLDDAIGRRRLAEEYADLSIVRFLRRRPLDTLRAAIDRGVNAPPASSAGRLFDAVAAVIGVCREEAGFEGQAGMALEALAAPRFHDRAAVAYPVARDGDELAWGPLWEALLGDLRDGVDPGLIAARFHHGLAAAVAATALALCHHEGLETVALGGGVFQNRLLLERTCELLRQDGVRVLAPAELPANDGGLSLGQAVVAAAGGGTRNPLLAGPG